eukprot:5790456-Pleurochrysis_carterae.AAC.1
MRRSGERRAERVKARESEGERERDPLRTRALRTNRHASARMQLSDKLTARAQERVATPARKNGKT